MQRNTIVCKIPKTSFLLSSMIFSTLEIKEQKDKTYKISYDGIGKEVMFSLLKRNNAKPLLISS